MAVAIGGGSSCEWSAALTARRSPSHPQRHRGTELWDVARHRRVGALTGHTGAIRAFAFGPTGRRLRPRRRTTPYGWDTKLHLACERGRKVFFLPVIAGQRGDWPQFRLVLAQICGRRMGPGPPAAGRSGFGPAGPTFPRQPSLTCVDAGSTAPCRSRSVAAGGALLQRRRRSAIGVEAGRMCCDAPRGWRRRFFTTNRGKPGQTKTPRRGEPRPGSDCRPANVT
jgi:hypothetical protein